MSTRSTTHFIRGEATDAIVYRHSDGYPEGHGKDLYEFFAEVEAQTSDTRFSDPSYLAAKLIVWLASKFAPYQHYALLDLDERQDAATAAPLDFLGVAPVMSDPSDIEYRYVVDCGDLDEKGRPKVTCLSVYDRMQAVPIPA